MDKMTISKLPHNSYSSVELVELMTVLHNQGKLRDLDPSLISHFYSYKKVKQFLNELTDKDK